MTEPQAEPRTHVLDPGVQQERTALAWERTSISIMVVATLLIRLGATQNWFFVALGLVYLAIGASTLVWASHHYVELHDLTASDTEVVHPTAARVLGLSAITLSLASGALAVQSW